MRVLPLDHEYVLNHCMRSFARSNREPRHDSGVGVVGAPARTPSRDPYRCTAPAVVRKSRGFSRRSNATFPVALNETASPACERLVVRNVERVRSCCRADVSPSPRASESSALSTPSGAKARRETAFAPDVLPHEHPGLDSTRPNVSLTLCRRSAAAAVAVLGWIVGQFGH
jgi:hypothetical protein